MPKPLVPLGGRPLLAHALDAALASGLAPVLVIMGNGAPEVEAWVAAHASGVRSVANPHWREGIAASLRCALEAVAEDAAVDAVVVGLADQPLVGAQAYRRLAVAYDGGARFAVATYGGVRGNPVLIGRELWADALALRGDEGARQLMRHHPVEEVPCDATGDPIDIDTADDLAEVERRLAGDGMT